MNVIAFLCFVAACVIFVLLAVTAITDGSFLYWGLGLIAAGLAIQNLPAVNLGTRAAPPPR